MDGGLYTHGFGRTPGGLVKYCCRSPPEVLQEYIRSPSRLQID